MIIKGRCRGNGSQLGRYLLNTLDNDRAEFLTMQGATSNDPRRALLEMSLTSEITGRTDAGLYHMQLSPRASEADMTFEEKTRSIEITAKTMGLDGHRWALFEHEKDGRTHLHLVFERYDHETGRMWSDTNNYEKHQQAARQMEIEFGWQLTHEKKNVLDRDIKAHITDLWHESDNGREFVQAMHKAGFEVTQGMDKRPYQIIDQYGTVHDLTRQLQGIKQRDVSEYLNSIRRELRPTAEASHDRRQEHDRPHPAPVQSDNLRELSDSQDRMTALKINYKQAVKEKEKQPQTISYNFKIQQTYRQPPPEPENPLPFPASRSKKHSLIIRRKYQSNRTKPPKCWRITGNGATINKGESVNRR